METISTLNNSVHLRSLVFVVGRNEFINVFSCYHGRSAYTCITSMTQVSPKYTLREKSFYILLMIGFLYMGINPLIYATKFEPVKRVLLRMIPCYAAQQNAQAGSVSIVEMAAVPRNTTVNSIN